MKILFSFLICTLFCVTVSAQTGFFGKMEKPAITPQIQRNLDAQRNIIGKTTVTAVDSTFFAVRPTIVPSAFSITSGRVSAGAGFGLKRMTYNYSTQKFYTNWSINALGLLGGVIAPTTPQMAASYALTLGLLNDIVNIGVEFNSRKDPDDAKFKLKPDLLLSYTINFNN